MYLKPFLIPVSVINKSTFKQDLSIEKIRKDSAQNQSINVNLRGNSELESNS